MYSSRHQTSKNDRPNFVVSSSIQLHQEMAHAVQTHFLKYRRWHDAALGQRRHLLIQRRFKIPLAFDAMMDNRLDDLEAFEDPHEASQTAQDMLWARMEFSLVDVTD